MDPDADRLTEGAFAGLHALREPVHVLGGPGDVLPERAVRAGRRHEIDVRTQVVRPPSTVLALAARDTGLYRHPVADCVVLHGVADLDDPPGALVAENQRFLNGPIAHLSVLVPVDIGPADADIGHLHKDFRGLRGRRLLRADLEGSRFGE